ncbi:MAG: hypothetical protein NUV42_00745 [Candidatus Yonathbacteria bacterium]|nr:hypothetical protein [Candidatus Yonathbacteria bacterium]
MDTYIERRTKTGIQRFVVLSRELDNKEKLVIAELRLPGGVVAKFFDLYLEHEQQALMYNFVKERLDLRLGQINNMVGGVNATFSRQDIPFVLLYEGYVRGSRNPIGIADRRYRFFRIAPHEPQTNKCDVLRYPISVSL